MNECADAREMREREGERVPGSASQEDRRHRQRGREESENEQQSEK